MKYEVWLGPIWDLNENEIRKEIRLQVHDYIFLYYYYLYIKRESGHSHFDLY